LKPPFGGNPLEFGDEIWRQKTRVLGLPDGKEIMPLAFFVLTQYRRETDGHVAIAITRASIALHGKKLKQQKLKNSKSLLCHDVISRLRRNRHWILSVERRIDDGETEDR